MEIIYNIFNYVKLKDIDEKTYTQIMTPCESLQQNTKLSSIKSSQSDDNYLLYYISNSESFNMVFYVSHLQQHKIIIIRYICYTNYYVLFNAFEKLTLLFDDNDTIVFNIPTNSNPSIIVDYEYLGFNITKNAGSTLMSNNIHTIKSILEKRDYLTNINRVKQKFGPTHDIILYYDGIKPSLSEWSTTYYNILKEIKSNKDYNILLEKLNFYDKYTPDFNTQNDISYKRSYRSEHFIKHIYHQRNFRGLYPLTKDHKINFEICKYDGETQLRQYNYDDSLVKYWDDTPEYKLAKQNEKKDLSIIIKEFKNQTYLSPELLKTSSKECVIKIYNMDIIDLTELLLADKSQLRSICILNLAYSKTPGGGVLDGSIAQEEEIFRRTDAHISLGLHDYSDQFKMQKDERLKQKTHIDSIINGEVFYSHKVTIVTGKLYNKYCDEDLGSFSMISAAATNIKRPFNTVGIQVPLQPMSIAIIEKTLFTIENVFRTAIKKGHTTLILGAIGCGAFNNDPDVVFKLFEICIHKYHRYFNEIFFAILKLNKLSGRDYNNYNIFKKLELFNLQIILYKHITTEMFIVYKKQRIPEQDLPIDDIIKYYETQHSKLLKMILVD